MNCNQARQLIDAGIGPGTQTPERAQLGFHLAQCAMCRAYHATAQQQLLAAMLLGEMPARPAVPAAKPRKVSQPAPEPPPPPAPAPPVRADIRPLLAWAVGIVGVIVIAVFVVPSARSALRIHENIQAMTSLPQPTEVPLAVAPTVFLPTVTPPAPTIDLPTATATIAPTATLVPTATPPDPGRAITVLLLGSDRRPGEQGAARTDAIVIARIDPVAHRVALLSLPRDLYLPIADGNYGRINAAVVYGRNDGSEGLETAKATISTLLGTPIDYSMLIDFQGFIAAIDSLGGVTVNVERDLVDNRFPTMDYGYASVYFPKGPQHFDGEQALTYSRIRHPDSDFARMKRQQAVLTSVLGQLRQQNVAADLASLEAVTTALRDHVRTDLPEERILGLAWALRELTPEAVERQTLGADMVSFGVGDDRWAEQPLPGTIETLVALLLGTQ